MDKTCNPEQLYERKFPKNELPLKKCAECLFNVLCLDYSTYEESNDWDFKYLDSEEWENIQ
jgi:hypothetical protein